MVRWFVLHSEKCDLNNAYLRLEVLYILTKGILFLYNRENHYERLYRKMMLNAIGKIVINLLLKDFNKTLNLFMGRSQFFHKMYHYLWGIIHGEGMAPYADTGDSVVFAFFLHFSAVKFRHLCLEK
jgi:hypothetical protein